MNLIEIKDAAFNGKTFTLKNVHLESIDFGSIQTCIDNFGNPVLVKTATVKFVSPDIVDSVYNEEKDYPNIEITEQPKYDPCRPFKKGDIVEPVACNGRAPLYLRKYIGTKQVVECDEDLNGIVGIVGDVEAVSAAFIKLVTPVEELEPYSIGKSDYNGFVNIEKKGKIIAMIPYGKELHEHKTREEAFAAAEAERDRLNAEYRKEQNNG